MIESWIYKMYTLIETAKKKAPENRPHAKEVSSNPTIELAEAKCGEFQGPRLPFGILSKVRTFRVLLRLVEQQIPSFFFKFIRTIIHVLSEYHLITMF